MIKVRIVGQEGEEKKFNGLLVFLNVLESDADRCSDCDQSDVAGVMKRGFTLAKVLRGAVPLRLDSHFSREVKRYVREKMGHNRCLCSDCFEAVVDDSLGGFEPAD